MNEMGFWLVHQRLNPLVPLQLLVNVFIPEPIVVVIEIHWQIGHALFPLQMNLRGFIKTLLLFFHCRHASQFLILDFL